MLSMLLNVGDKAPDFRLYSDEKKEVSLGDFKGENVVLLFFPMAFTSTCTKELCTVRDNISMYNGLHAHVMGVSVDAPYSLAKYKEEQNLNFPLLSDFNKEIIRSYDVYHENFAMGMKGVAKRAVFVIDGEGIIRHIEVLDSLGELPNFEKITLTLQNLN